MKLFLQALDGYLAADAFAAIKNNRFTGIYFIHLLHDLPQRNQYAADVEFIMFILLPHINQLEVFAAVDPLFECFRRNGLHTMKYSG